MQAHHSPTAEVIQPSSPRFTPFTPTSGAQRKMAIAVDLSDESAYAVKWAVPNYLRPGDAVILLHVRPTSVIYGAYWGSIDLSVSTADTDEESQRKLEDDFTTTKATDIAQPLVDARIPFKLHIVKDHDMKERLCLEVERLGLSAVIMGSRGFGASRRTTKGRLGSVSDYCVYHCVCPVVVVRYPDEKGTSGGSTLTGITSFGNKDLEQGPLPEEEPAIHEASDDKEGTLRSLPKPIRKLYAIEPGTMGALDKKEFPDTAIFSDDFHPLDPEEFRKQAHQVIDFIADYYKNIESYPVLSQVEPGFLKNWVPDRAPLNPEPLEAILSDVEKVILPGMTHWANPNFFAYFPATISTAGFLGEMLSTSFNAVCFNWLASPAATELETAVMDWLAKLLRLPKFFLFSSAAGGGGVIQGTTTESILCTVVAARDLALARGLPSLDVTKLVVYGSDQTHSAYAKACGIAGILPRNIRSIPTSVDDAHLALSPARLRKAMEADVVAGLVPLFLCATVGTTSTTAVDPVGELADVAREYGAWVHVDAAYAGSACICPEFRGYLDGVEKVDSLSMSPHKWMLSHLDCCCLWVRSAASFTQGLRTNPEYLQNKVSNSRSVVEYKDWQVGTGRRFRALRLWLVLRSYGVAKLQAHIRSDVRMAHMFEGFVREDPRFEVVVPRRFGLVCFRLAPRCLGLAADSNRDRVNQLNRVLLEEVNSTGEMYATHTMVGGAYTLRFSMGTTTTRNAHVVAAWELIQNKANALVGKR